MKHLAILVTQNARSINMRAIKRVNTEPELLIRKGLYNRGYRYRLHKKDLPGHPDIVLKKYHALIFVNGCFWHGHKCHLSKIPKTHTEFWLKKISSNMSRDAAIYQKILKSEWRVAIIWGCAIKGKTKWNFDFLIDELEKWLRDFNSKSIEISGKSLPIEKYGLL